MSQCRAHVFEGISFKRSSYGPYGPFNMVLCEATSLSGIYVILLRQFSESPSMLGCSLRQFDFCKIEFPENLGRAQSDEVALFVDFRVMEPIERFPGRFRSTTLVKGPGGLRPTNSYVAEEGSLMVGGCHAATPIQVNQML